MNQLVDQSHNKRPHVRRSNLICVAYMICEYGDGEGSYLATNESESTQTVPNAGQGFSAQA